MRTWQGTVALVDPGDVEELPAERGGTVDPVTIYRWVQVGQ